MTLRGPIAADPFHDALFAAQLCAIDPDLGGMSLRGGAGLREQIATSLGLPVRRLPLHVDDDRLVGGLDLAATLGSGAAVLQPGLLAEIDGGVLLAPMAERLPDEVAGKIAVTMDAREVTVERGGRASRTASRFILVLFDNGIEPEERPPELLLERIAFWIDLTETRALEPPPARRLVANSNAASPLSQDTIEAVTAAASKLGISSIRAMRFALKAAVASARLHGRASVNDEDLAIAARLVLAPRATSLPATDRAAPDSKEPAPPKNGDGSSEPSDVGSLEDMVLAAALAALPPDVLKRIAEGSRSRGRSRSTGSGERRKGVRGRPLGARSGKPGGNHRLALIDTLRAAAPWQGVRGRTRRVLIRRDDLRVRRFETRAETTTIFAVDASGSSALGRLAEAKGAVELLLTESYVKRAEVALIAFRSDRADLVLPPTRSLTRARRLLAELPGGGGTPLAAGLAMARDVASASRQRGRTPFVVLMTDGSANIALDGSGSRSRAAEDADASARELAADSVDAAFIDISARPRPEGNALAAAMGARYLALPRANSEILHQALRNARPR